MLKNERAASRGSLSAGWRAEIPQAHSVQDDTVALTNCSERLSLCHNATPDTIVVPRNLACGNLTGLPVDIDVDAGVSDGEPGRAVLAVHSTATGKLKIRETRSTIAAAARWCACRERRRNARTLPSALDR
jgi:hypothetical protein